MGCSSSKIDSEGSVGVVPSSSNNLNTSASNNVLYNKNDTKHVTLKRSNTKLIRQKTKKDVEKSYLTTTLTVIVVGGSGDLAKKKTFPSLLQLYLLGFLPENKTNIIGYARTEYTDSSFREKIKPYLAKYVKDEPGKEKKLKDFLNLITYMRGTSYGDEEAWEAASSIYDLDNHENGRPSTAPASTAAGPDGTQGPLLAKKRKPLSVLDFDVGGQFALAGGKRGDRVVAVNNRIVVTGDQLMEEIEQMQLLGERNIVVEVKRTKRWDRSSTERLYEDAQHRTHRRKQLAAKHHPPPSFQPSISPSNAARSSTVEADGRSEYEGGNDGEISSSSSSSSHTGGAFGREEFNGGVFARLWEHAERAKEDKKAAIAAQNAALSSFAARQRSRRFRESPQEAKKRQEKILRKSQVCTSRERVEKLID